MVIPGREWAATATITTATAIPKVGATVAGEVETVHTHHRPILSAKLVLVAACTFPGLLDTKKGHYYGGL